MPDGLDTGRRRLQNTRRGHPSKRKLHGYSARRLINMSYKLHITRGDNFWDDGPRRIAREEWEQIVAVDPDLKLYDASEADQQDPVYRLEIPDLDNAFYYSEFFGGIEVGRGYFEDVVWKVLEIAAKLGAVVQGDEGEFYRLTESGRETTYERPDPAI
jgi:hypothetical protein